MLNSLVLIITITILYSNIETITYYKNGEIYAINKYDNNNKKHGLQMTYYPNGSTHTIATYKHGKKEGISILYDSSGYIICSFTFKNNKLNGLLKTYYSNFITKMVIPIVNGMPNGIGKMYNYNGELEYAKIFIPLDAKKIQHILSIAEAL